MCKINYNEITAIGTLFFSVDQKGDLCLFYLSRKYSNNKFAVTRITENDIPENENGFPLYSLDNFCNESGFDVTIVE